MIVGRFLDYAADHYPDKNALVFYDRRITYRQLKNRVQRLSSGLTNLGIKKGDRVSTLMWNCTELIEIYLATVRLGAIFTPLNYRLTRAELEYVLNDSLPSILVIDQRNLDLIKGIVSDPKLLKNLYCTADDCPAGMKPFEELIVDNLFSADVPLDVSDPCQLIYTSGTTGKPKGVILTHENIVWNSINMLLVRHDSPRDRALIIGPLFHTAALNSHYTSRLALGATAVILDRFDPKLMMETIQKERITVVSGAPTVYIMLMEFCKPGDYDTSSVTTLTSGADKLPLQVQKAIREYFSNIEGVYDVYGSTECSPCVTTLEARDSLTKVGSVGPPLPYVEVKLLDAQDNEVKRGEIGEIVVKGSVVMSGYYKQPEETAKVLKDGWFYTGDLAWADEDGYLYFSDRKKDVIVSGGENIASREVEDVLFKHPDVVKAAVFGVPDDKWGERVVAAIIPRQGRTPRIEEIRAFAKQHLSSYKIPREIMILDKLPESGTGKAQKHELRKLYQASYGGKK